MPRTRAELKAELKAEAERLIDELLTWTEQVEAPTLTEIEDQILKLRKQFGEKLAEAAVEVQSTAEPILVRCPHCQRPMHLKKKHQRWRVVSRVCPSPSKPSLLLLRPLPGRAFSPWNDN